MLHKFSEECVDQDEPEWLKEAAKLVWPEGDARLKESADIHTNKEENVASILSLAEEAEAASELYGLALACMVGRLSDIKKSEFWTWLPVAARDKVLDLHKLCSTYTSCA